MPSKRDESFRQILCRGASGIPRLLEMEQVAEGEWRSADAEMRMKIDVTGKEVSRINFVDGRRIPF